MSSLDLTLSLKPPCATSEEPSHVVQLPFTVTDPPDLKKDLIFVLLKFFEEEKLFETMHKLEKESGVYFNLKYFEETISVGDWEEAEDYLSGFIKIADGVRSANIFYYFYRHKCFELLRSGDRLKALDILNNELKAIQPTYPQSYKEMALHITSPRMSRAGPVDAESYHKLSRARAISDIKAVIAVHPQLRDKMHFPAVARGRLSTLISQSFSGQDVIPSRQLGEGWSLGGSSE